MEKLFSRNSVSIKIPKISQLAFHSDQVGSKGAIMKFLIENIPSIASWASDPQAPTVQSGECN